MAPFIGVTAHTWLLALGSSLLVSCASLFCLALLPFITKSRDASRSLPEGVVHGMAAFAVGAMLGDTLLHQMPSAYSSASSHEHSHNHEAAAVCALAGIMVFFLIEKLVHNTLESSRSKAGSRGPAVHQNGGTDFDQDKPAGASMINNSQLESQLRLRQVKGTSPGTPETPSANGKPSGMAQESHSARQHHGHGHGHSHCMRAEVGWLNLIADGIHNFTDGLAIGAGFVQGGAAVGWNRTLFILVHELPQEFGDYSLLVGSGFEPWQALFWNFISALSSLAGTLCALLMGSFWTGSGGGGHLMEAFIAGGFIYISLTVLVELARSPRTLLPVMAVAVGFALSYAVHMYSCSHEHHDEHHVISQDHHEHHHEHHHHHH